MFPIERVAMSDADRAVLTGREPLTLALALQAGGCLALLTGGIALAISQVVGLGDAGVPVGVGAALAMMALAILHYVREVAPRERERRAAQEQELEAGEVELLALPEAGGAVLLAHAEEPVAVCLELGERSFVLEVQPGVELLSGRDPARLPGSTLALARGPISKTALPFRWSGEPLAVTERLDVTTLAEGWFPHHGELLEAGAAGLAELLRGPEPTNRRSVWPDAPAPEE